MHIYHILMYNQVLRLWFKDFLFQSYNERKNLVHAKCIFCYAQKINFFKHYNIPVNIMIFRLSIVLSNLDFFKYISFLANISPIHVSVIELDKFLLDNEHYVSTFCTSEISASIPYLQS